MKIRWVAIFLTSQFLLYFRTYNKTPSLFSIFFLQKVPVLSNEAAQGMRHAKEKRENYTYFY